MTRRLTVFATVVSIGTVGFVLFCGMTGRASTLPFETAVLILNIAIPLASILLTWHLWRDGQHAPALLSSSPLVLMVAGTAMARSGNAPSLAILLLLDGYVFVAFVVVLGWRGREVLSQSNSAAPNSTREVV